MLHIGKLFKRSLIDYQSKSVNGFDLRDNIMSSIYISENHFIFLISNVEQKNEHEKEPRHEKTNVLHMQKQRRRSASRYPRS